MTPSENTDLRHVGRSLARRRWTAVVTSAGIGTVLVALAARLGPPAAVATALFAVAAVAANVRLAVGEDRRWRRAFGAVRNDGVHTARRDPTGGSA
ncbi:MAG: hypothetical protein AB7H92_17375 [Microbacteriaceae bacterium]